MVEMWMVAELLGLQLEKKTRVGLSAGQHLMAVLWM
jgi:hypothetical protein